MKIPNYARGAGKTYEAVEYAKRNKCILVISYKVEKEVSDKQLVEIVK